MPKKGNITEKIRDRLFPEVRLFPTKKGRFSPFPWILRDCLSDKLIKQQWWAVLSYIMLRCGPERMWNVENKEIAHALGYSGPAKVAPMVKGLAELGFIKTKEEGGKQYVVVINAEFVVSRLVRAGRFPEKYLADLRADCEKMGIEWSDIIGDPAEGPAKEEEEKDEPLPASRGRRASGRAGDSE